LKCCCWLEERS